MNIKWHVVYVSYVVPFSRFNEFFYPTCIRRLRLAKPLRIYARYLHRCNLRTRDYLFATDTMGLNYDV